MVARLGLVSGMGRRGSVVGEVRGPASEKKEPVVEGLREYLVLAALAGEVSVIGLSLKLKRK